MLLESAKHESSTHFYHIHHVGNSLCIRRTMFLGVSDTPVVTKSYLSQTDGFVIDFPPFWKVRALALRPGEKPPLCLTGTYGKKSPKKKTEMDTYQHQASGPRFLLRWIVLEIKKKESKVLYRC